tara:strand:- start:74 stop:532 length:459 start_codon:yes stop_codon:yes gene_type:complete
VERYKISYSIREDEFNEEVERILVSSSEYLEKYDRMFEIAMSLSSDGNYEGCINTIGRLRASLSEADYRLHDLANLIMSFLQSQAMTNVNLEQHQEVQDTQDPPTIDVSKIEESKTRAQQIKTNIESLGVDMSEEQLKELTRRVDDKAGRSI